MRSAADSSRRRMPHRATRACADRDGPAAGVHHNDGEGGGALQRAGAERAGASSPSAAPAAQLSAGARPAGDPPHRRAAHRENSQRRRWAPHWGISLSSLAMSLSFCLVTTTTITTTVLISDSVFKSRLKTF